MTRKPEGSGNPPEKKGRTAKLSNKDKGHPRNHRKRQAKREPEEQATARAAKPKGRRQRSNVRADEGSHGEECRPEIVVTIGHGHPRLEPETYDAAALLKSVLAALEPKLDDGLAALAEAASHTAGASEAGAGAIQAVRTVGRQIAEALRAGVMEGMRVRERHLAQLAVIDRAAAHASSLSRIQERLTAEIEHAGLRRISDLADLSPFNLADSGGASSDGTGSQGSYELVTPAYVDADSGRVVERGWIKKAETAPVEMPGGEQHGRISRNHGDERRDTKNDVVAELLGDSQEHINQEPAAVCSSRDDQGALDSAGHSGAVAPRTADGTTAAQGKETRCRPAGPDEGPWQPEAHQSS